MFIPPGDLNERSGEGMPQGKFGNSNRMFNFLWIDGAKMLDLTPYYAREDIQAFKDRHATMPWRGSTPVAKENLLSNWQQLLSRPAA